ncbi:hypothetical protein J2Y54_002998 [Sphingomonas sp. BE123]|jgi:hypothetical protein|uniref:hypothetical protein n=1 Tax=unclassified Sphingomonas TaxID=196159 RepID=UPI0028568953|nr:hypothetical protein [Sphingomonas sp. BE123]MDR6853478.1 hypothetical protein [Sphingomonas sp. BE123]
MDENRNSVSVTAATDPLISTLHSAVAGELRHVRALIEELAEVLVGDEHFVDRYLDKLQAFDLLVQCTEESAAVLDRLADGACTRSAIAPVRLGQIHERLHAALQAAH